LKLAFLNDLETYETYDFVRYFFFLYFDVKLNITFIIVVWYILSL